MEKDVNPLHPWDVSLPLFISDPRYVLLPSVSVRREVFDDYCRERARQLREENVKTQKEAMDPKETFDRLLQDEVKSTRTYFRRAWKKDRRFWGWGRDDKERERRFRECVKDLGESWYNIFHRGNLMLRRELYQGNVLLPRKPKPTSLHYSRNLVQSRWMSHGKM